MSTRAAFGPSGYELTAELWPRLNLTDVTSMRWPGRSRPIRVNSVRAPLAVRIARSVVRQPDGCWIWAGPADRDGYGRMKIGGRSVRLHRAVWAIHHGAPLPADEVARHTCDRPACLNPTHIVKGSVADNNHDRVRRDRSSYGERHYMSRLTEADVRDIRRRYAAGESQRALSENFGVCRQLISQIVLRQVWVRCA